MRKVQHILFGLTGATIICSTPCMADFRDTPPARWSESDSYNFLEYMAWVGLGGSLDLTMDTMGRVNRVPAIDAYAAVNALASASKPALLEYLKGRMHEANDNNQLAALGRFQAYYDALATGNNAALLQVVEEQQRVIEGTQESGDNEIGDDPFSSSVSSGGYKNPMLTTQVAATDFTWNLRTDLPPENGLEIEIQKLKELENIVKQARAEVKRIAAANRAQARARQQQRQQQQQQAQQQPRRNPFMPDLREAGRALEGIDDIPRPRFR